MKDLINIKNNGIKCFLWCQIKHLKPLKINSERVTKADENVLTNLDYESIKTSVSKKHFIEFSKI